MSYRYRKEQAKMLMLLCGFGVVLLTLISFLTGKITFIVPIICLSALFGKSYAVYEASK